MSLADFSLAMRTRVLDHQNLPIVPFHLDIFNLRGYTQNGLSPSETHRKLTQTIGNFKLVVPKQDSTHIKGLRKTLNNKYTNRPSIIKQGDTLLIGNITWKAAKDIYRYIHNLPEDAKIDHLGHYIANVSGQVEGYNKAIERDQSISAEFKSSLLNMTNILESNLKEFDKATSGLENSLDTEYLSTYEKTLSSSGMRYLASIECSKTNVESGTAAGAKLESLRSAVRRIIDLSGQRSKQGLSPDDFKVILDNDKELTKHTANLYSKLDRVDWSNLKGSKSIAEYTRAAILASLRGKSIPKEVSKGIIKIVKKRKLTYDGLSYVSSLASTLRQELDSARATIRAVSTKKKVQASLQGKFTSLTNLQNLINSQLHDQIQRNMGTGDARNVLNYRTGRFANSAKVEKMSISREGAISAFYSYMKYPYQTFEPGFAQGSPASRNPRLLISKSVREIAAKLITNRMRAVVI